VNAHPVGIVVALATEAKALSPKPWRTGQATVLDHGDLGWLGGMGQEAARHAAEGLVAAGATALAAFGVAGALAPGLRSGTLFCPSCIMDERGHDYLPTPAWRASLHQRLLMLASPILTEGHLLSLPSPLLRASDKAAMRQHHLAAAVDMESAAVAAVATERRLPFIVLRAIVDERDDDIPAELTSGIDAWGRPLPLRVATLLMRHPSLIGRLPGLASRMCKATRALRAAAELAGSGLGRDPPQPC
jgi:nucleoside phosphorylase